MNDFAEMFADFEFNAPAGRVITEVNGISLPEDYLEFMTDHDGGEGPVGENAYMQLVRLEELESFNEEYEIAQWLPDIALFGTDLGGMLFGFSAAKEMYCAVDACSMTEEDVFYAGRTFEEFVRAVDAGEL